MPIHEKKLYQLDWCRLMLFEKNCFCSTEIEFLIVCQAASEIYINLSIFMSSLIQLSGADCHLFHHENCK